MKRPPNNLRIARARANLTVSAVCKRLDVARNTYWRWESGKTPVPLQKVTLLSEMFGVSREFLVGWRPTSEEFAELEGKERAA